MFRVLFHTHNRDKRRDRVTGTVTKNFKTLEAAQAWATQESPLHHNIYQYHEGVGWWSIRTPLPGRAA
jgi:hypothetical protein